MKRVAQVPFLDNSSSQANHTKFVLRLKSKKARKKKKKMITAQVVLYSYPYSHRHRYLSSSPLKHSSHGYHNQIRRQPLYSISRRPKKRNPSSWNIRCCASTSQSQLPPPYEGQQGKVSDLNILFQIFWKVAAPYWFSDDKVQARLQLGTVFALTLATTGISVGFSFLGRDFFNALANKDQEQFTKQLIYYLCGFAGGIPFFVLRDYARETLSLRWRCWMTSYFMQRYLSDRTFYKIQSQSIIDNPDQRIVDDLNSFTSTALSFSLTLFNALVDLISFSNILYTIYPPLFVVLLLYSIGGTVISIFLGKGLVTLNFLQEKKEADFRYGLVRVRENAESIAFYGGEDNELQLLLQRFTSAFENLTQLLISSRNLDFFTSGYRYLIQILPAAVVAPMYFSGKIEFGVINQSVSAFNHILGDVSLIVYQFQAISAFSAVIYRLGEFDDVLDSSRSKCLSDPMEHINLTYSSVKGSQVLDGNGSIPAKKSLRLLDVENLSLKMPKNNSTLVRDLSFAINEKDHLLVTGPSGSGKTSLLRALAGLWSTGKGKITFYLENGGDAQSLTSSDVAPVEVNSANINEEFGRNINSNSRSVFFLPQRPYMVLGTLRQQLLYPTWAEAAIVSDGTKPGGSLPFLTRVSNFENVGENCSVPIPSTEDLKQVLEDVRLGYILSRFKGLDSVYEWSSVLSLGEQQRLAFARLLLSKPKLALLDESTSALDEVNEDKDSGKTIGHSREWDGLYYLEALSQSKITKGKLPSSFVSELYSSNKDKVWLHHCRLGHPSFRVIKILFPSLFQGLDVESFHCEACQLAKHKRVPLPVETVAQFGVIFLLFALGLEFSTTKLRVVRAVAVLGGLLQIFLFMCLCGITVSLCGGKPSEGVFVGAFLSMSSTAVVLKFLMERNSISALHGQVTIGTLILQDCAVGLLFALLPVLGGSSGVLQGVLSMTKSLVTLITFLAILTILSRTCVPWFLKLMISLSSRTNELYQLASVAFCLLVAWCSDKLGLSLELGSFAAGVMISTTDLGPHTLEQVEPIRNFFAALFLASIGMLIHVHFLWNHVDILLAAVILVIVIKTMVVAAVVKGFRYSNKTSLLVGMSLAQIGEFAFVLLSRASNLHLVEGKLYLLLLGTTALSLVTTPLLFKLIPAVIHLGVLLRWFPPDTPSEIGIKGDSLRADSAKRITLMVQGSHDS